MATIYEEPKRSGRRTVQFIGADDKRRKIRVGKMSHRNAEEIGRHVETIIAAKVAGFTIGRATAEWISGIGDDLHAKLAAAGLAEPRAPVIAVELKAFLDGYLAERTDAKPSTKTNLRVCINRLVDSFGAAAPLDSVTAEQAATWAAKLREDYAAATASRTIRRARQLFAVAIERGIIKANPFIKVKAGKETNTDRRKIIDRDTITAVLDACPSTE